MVNVSDVEMQEIHDLITGINMNCIQLERDVRNLNNLIHFVKGDGIRNPEFR